MKYLKNNKGMALPMVLAIMTILSILATGLAVLAHNSYISVRWMSDQKKAQFLSRAGVEAASFAYQNAVSKTSNNFGDIGQYGSFSEIDKFVAIAQNSDATITSNRIYLCYDASNENNGTKWEGLSFKTFANDSEALAYDPIGYFYVEIGNGVDVVSMTNSDGVTQDQDVDVKVFKCTGVCNDMTQITYGYITPTDYAASLKLYDADGYLSTEASINNGADGKFVKSDKVIKYDTNITDENDGFFTRIFKGIIKTIFSAFNETSRNISVYGKVGQGNVVLSKPDNSNFIKTNDNKDNFYIFATSGDLFLKDCGLQVTPTKGKYASIGLYGDEIVIDKDITMEVYCTNTNSLLGNKLQSTIDTIGNRFRLGTVILGNGTSTGSSRRDPVPANKGGISYKNSGDVPVNKVYFNGNVYVKIYTQGSATETYRVFNAGDIAYFYGLYTVNGSTAGEKIEATGIDLLKYFIDAVIAGKDGHVYGNALIEKMKQINSLYYGDSSASYFENGNCLVRKVNVEYSANGKVSVDNGYGSVEDIIQPDTISASGITWGKPRKGTSFD